MENILRKIEQELNSLSSRVIEHSVLVNILKKFNYQNCNDKIARLKKQGVLTLLKKGVYLYEPTMQSQVFKEQISNILYGPSYVSLEYALSYYGLIPERVYVITALTTNRSKSFKNPYGLFQYLQIPSRLFSIGLEIKSVGKISYLMASKEKALCDKIYMLKDMDLRSKKRMRECLEEDLRVDFEELSGARLEIFEQYLQVSKSKKIETLKTIVEDMQ